MTDIWIWGVILFLIIMLPTQAAKSGWRGVETAVVGSILWPVFVAFVIYNYVTGQGEQ
jgi:hypothetical protein